MRTTFMLITLLLSLSLAVAGCDKPPQVSGTLTVSVANELPGDIPDVAFAAGLDWVNQQLADEGLHVQLAPATQNRGGDPPEAVLVATRSSTGDGPLQIVVSGGDHWREEVRDQVLAAFGR